MSPTPRPLTAHDAAIKLDRQAERLLDVLLSLDDSGALPDVLTARSTPNLTRLRLYLNRPETPWPTTS